MSDKPKYQGSLQLTKCESDTVKAEIEAAIESAIGRALLCFDEKHHDAVEREAALAAWRWAERNL